MFCCCFDSHVRRLGAASRELIPVASCGHVPHEERPETFLHYLFQFLERRVTSQANTPSSGPVTDRDSTDVPSITPSPEPAPHETEI